MTQLPSSILSPPLLLASDGSPSAEAARALVRSIAELFVGQSVNNEDLNVLTVVTVQPRLPKRLKRSPKQVTPELSPPTDQDTQTATATVATSAQSSAGLSLEQLTEWVQVSFSADFPLSLQVRQGRPATEILNCARTINAGLIAVGHRGVGGVRELLLGSVSTAIARYAPCSVLVARNRPNAAVETSLRHVLLVVDHSIADQQALAVTRQLVSAGIQTITLLHVQPPLNASYLVAPFVARTSSWQLNQSLQDAQREQGEQILQQAAKALDLPDGMVQNRLHTGDTGPSICQMAQEIGANLIIIGSDPTRRSLLSPLQAVRLPRRRHNTVDNARPVLRNTRLSVTEDYVIHYAPCPVLLCRATAAAP